MMVPNLSRGINFIKKLLSDNDLSAFSKKVKINEIHHKNKKDSPSGTALELEKIIEEKNKEIKISINSTRDESSIGVHSIKIIKDTADGLWVSGIPQFSNLIVQGQGFVENGQIVAVTNLASL